MPGVAGSSNRGVGRLPGFSFPAVARGHILGYATDVGPRPVRDSSQRVTGSRYPVPSGNLPAERWWAVPDPPCSVCDKPIERGDGATLRHSVLLHTRCWTESAILAALAEREPAERAVEDARPSAARLHRLLQDVRKSHAPPD